ncbi:MAG: hypothetical protein C0410_05080 [Anaerolinea sp.]|nr:hypothetical protein [Anaerolinea sp.]
MKKRNDWLFWMLCFVLLVSCSQPNIGNVTYAWIDAPIDNLTIQNPQVIQIEGHASSLGTIERVDVSINDTPLISLTDFSSENRLVKFQTSWKPTIPGDYAIHIIAYASNGTSSVPDTALIHVGGVVEPEIPLAEATTSTPTATLEFTPTFTPTFTTTPTATATPTKTLTPILKPLIKFWAEPDTVAAGGCTSIKWNVTNAKKVIFGSIEQPLIGGDEECPCESKTYTLTVVGQSGQEEQRNLTVNVSGICDSTAPPAPTLVVPANGLSMGCKAAQSLTWLPIDDPSGISEYQVNVQKSGDNSDWTSLAGASFTGLQDKTVSLSVECGYYYRWQVRAIDGKGNVGAWSDWFYFAILLS